ncbi:PadR family transcriptional regulator [Nocardia sp. NPDC050175]|uniref:PadR family transcriptional regulator n=1 Tax=Nocardia sp. NPDC050175 TaxID=3364317 RepID=UPI0037AE60B6
MTAVYAGGLTDISILLLLSERPDHGYSLVHRLMDLGIFYNDDPGTVYRRLRIFERRGLIQHRVHHSQRGPVRKVYEIGPAGQQAIREWVPELNTTLNTIHRCLDLHSRIRASAVMPWSEPIKSGATV